VTPQKYFSHPSLVMYSFATPPIEQIGGGLLIANRLDESLWWANRKHWAGARSYLSHFFLQVHSAAAPFTGHGKRPNYVDQNPFPEPNQHTWIFFIQFYCAGSHSEHLRRWSKDSCILQPLDTTTDSKGPMPLVHPSKHTVTTYNGCKTLYVWGFNLHWVVNLVWGLNGEWM
jgi:hypothetical protein